MEAPTDILEPTDVASVQQYVAAAAQAGEALEVLAGGTKRGYGRPVKAKRTLAVGGLAGIVDYQPHELVLVARPGTPLVEIESTLAAAGQMLAFEPPHWGEGATLGGTVACNLAGPRRIKAGAARDHLLGFQAVTGNGEIIRGGGRVVKNVTGYDMSKLMCGSFGTLAVLCEVALKVLPRAETECTVLLAGGSDIEAIARLAAAARSSHEPSAMAHFPVAACLPDAARNAFGGNRPVTALRLEGSAVSLEQRSLGLIKGGPGATRVGNTVLGSKVIDHEVLDSAASGAFWRQVREVEGLPRRVGQCLWRVSVPPACGAAAAEGLRELGAERLYYDWGGGLIWASLPGKADAAAVHGLALRQGGHAQRLSFSGAGRSTGSGSGASSKGDRLTPLTPGQRRLNMNLKQAFDSCRILNPGRLYADL